MPPISKEEREKRLVRFVTSLQRRAQDETVSDRELWVTKDALFKGKQEWGKDRNNKAWQSKPFLHEFSALVRRTASIMCDLIFDKEDFIEIEAWDKDDPATAELARIFSKLVKYQNRKTRMQTVINELLLALGTYGLGILKIDVQASLVWTAEAIIEKIDKQERKLKNALASRVDNEWETIPEDETTATALVDDVLEELLGSESASKRALGPKKRFELAVVPTIVNPQNFFFEPDVEKIHETPYTIEKIYTKIFEIEKHFETGYFDKKKRKDIAKLTNVDTNGGTNAASTLDGQKIALRDQVPSKSQYTPNVELLQYYGPILDEDGSLLEEARHVVIGGGKVVLRDAPIDRFSQTHPYILVNCCPLPFKAVGAGVADNAVEHQLIINEVFATFLDSLRLGVYNAQVYDKNALESPEDIEDGIYPGQLISSYGKSAKEIFSSIPSDGLNAAPHVFNTLEMLRLSAEKGSGVDLNSGNPASRARISAREIGANQNRANQSQSTLARHLDENLLQPYAKAIVDLILQYGLERDVLKDFASQGVITESEMILLSNIPKIERYREVQRAIKVKVRGFRERMEKSEFLARTIDFLQELNSLPPEVRGMLNSKNMLEDIVDAFGFDANRWIVQNNPQDAAREENAILAKDQMISVGENDDDAMHLPVHFEQIMKTQNNATFAHIQGHMQRLQARGLPLPPVPPEVAQVLGMAEPQAAPTPQRRVIKARRSPTGELEGEVLDMPQEQPTPPIQ